MNAHIHIGSCAWAFEDWRGPFYPPDLPNSHWLAWYAHVFNTVEIDSTFYATPPPHTVAHWLAEAPPHFRFTCKAPKSITHERRLRGCDGLLNDFLVAMQPLHSRLGAILLQFPPSFSPDGDAIALRQFVLALPHGWKFAIEFRHPDWHQPRFVKLLEDHGVCWAWSDTTSLRDQNQAPFEILPETADFLYVRLMGDLQTRYDADGAPIYRYDKPLWSRAPAIENWAARLQGQANHAKNIYILCGNHYEGYAPATCHQLAIPLGLQINLPSLAAPQPAPASGPDERPHQMTLL